MATVTGVTAERAEALEEQLIASVTREGYSLVFTTNGGETISVDNAFPKPYEMHPVNSVLMTSRSDNPATYMGGGTWVRWGKGRVPVSLDEAQAEFDGVEETGGAKTHTLTVAEMPSHSHAVTNSNGGGSAIVGGDATVVAAGGDIFAATQPNGNPIVGNTGGGTAHNNLQPYITCYMWKRTA